MAKKQEAQKAIGYPEDIYLIADEQGNGQFYHNDPIKKENRKNGQFDLAQEIFEFMDGPSDIINPIKIRFMVYRIHRGDSFDGSIPERIRRGELDAHIEDQEGNIIEITGRLSNNKDFPLNAVVYDEDGVIKETRKYSANGECSDGNKNHRVVVMKGALNWNDPEE